MIFGGVPVSNVTCRARSVHNSISRIMNQDPTTRRLRGPMGPEVVHGVGRAGNDEKVANRNGMARTGAPRPRRHARVPSAKAREVCALTSKPCLSESTRYCDSTEGAYL